MKRIVSLVLTLIVLLSAVACAPAASQPSGPQGPIRPANLGVVDFHTELQQSYLEDSYLYPTGKGDRELSYPQSIKLSWESDIAADAYTVRLSESPDMSNAKEYTAYAKSMNVANLKAATTYYWTVTAEDTTSDVATFSTADCLPRNIHCAGVTNMRDLGGWKTADGGRVKQGLLYRSGQWRRVNEDAALITDEGIQTMRDLGIVTELDLREEAQGLVSRSEVEGVNYILCPMTGAGSFFVNNREMIVEIFEVLADEKNYPMVFHCAIGTDRTGYIAFLINALLGVAQEDLYRDYMFSNYGNIGSSRALGGVRNDYMDRILKYGDGTSAENCEAFLLEIGVEQAHIDAVRAILLES